MLCRIPLVFLSLLAASVLATQELDSDSFAKFKASGKNGMVKFFQPWCGHCTAMKPAWDELADNVDNSVFIADVNCSDEQDVCEEVGVKGYPTIKVYQDGEVTDYKGGRSFEDLLEYVDNNLAIKCKIDNTAEGCSEKALKYIGKWKAKDKSDVAKELTRLEGMVGKSMTSELKGWLRERMSILKQMVPASSEEEEL